MGYRACVEEAGPLEKVRPDEIKVGLREKLEYCPKCRGELSDFFTSVISDKRLRIVRARCQSCGQRYVQFKPELPLVRGKLGKVVDDAEPWMQIMQDEIPVDADDKLKFCKSCGAPLVDHFRCISAGHNWDVLRAVCGKCGKKYVRFKRIYKY